MKENDINFYNSSKLDLLSSDYFKEDLSNFYKNEENGEIDNLYIGGKSLIVNTKKMDNRYIPLIFNLDSSFNSDPSFTNFNVSSLLLKNLTKERNTILINGEEIKNKKYLYIDTELDTNVIELRYKSDINTSSMYDKSLVLYEGLKYEDDSGMPYPFIISFLHEKAIEKDIKYSPIDKFVVVKYKLNTAWYKSNELVATMSSNSTGPYH